MIDFQPFDKLREWGRLLKLSRQIRRGWKSWERDGNPEQIRRQCRNQWLSSQEAELLQNLLTPKLESDNRQEARQALLVLRSLRVGDYPVRDELIEIHLRGLLEYAQSWQTRLQAAVQHGSAQKAQEVREHIQQDPDCQFVEEHPGLASFWIIWLLNNRGDHHEVPPYWLSLAARSTEAQNQSKFKKVLRECKAPEAVATLAQKAGAEEFPDFVQEMLDMSNNQEPAWGQKLAEVLTQATDSQLQQLQHHQIEHLLQHHQGGVRQAAMRIAGRMPTEITQEEKTRHTKETTPPSKTDRPNPSASDKPDSSHTRSR